MSRADLLDRALVVAAVAGPVLYWAGEAPPALGLLFAAYVLVGLPPSGGRPREVTARG